jgi:UDP-GlcNAc:undecaprenyl-phosphate GlcNAc-1-phosphate transferase
VLLLPLADCVSLMARRIRAGKSPFCADRHHIHHYLLTRGFNHNQVVGILAAVSLAFGAVGFAGWRAGVPQSLLFWPFFVGYFAYHAWIQRAWNRLAAQGSPGDAVATLEPAEARATF